MLQPQVDQILDERIVAQGPETKASWVLTPTKDGGTNWFPCVFDSDTGELIKVAKWMPLPGAQVRFLECPVYEALYHGNRGGGKTLLLLFDYAREVGKGYEDAWRGILFRKTFGDLDDVVRKIEDWFPTIWPGFRFKKSKSEYQAVWPTGEALLLRHMIDESDYSDYHGHEYPWIGWEELTQWENDKAYKLMMSCSRPPRPGVPTRVRSTTNPHGPGHSWVKRRFQLPDQDGKIIRKANEMPRVAIKGSMLENFVMMHSQPLYRTIIRQAAKNPAQAKAWMDGDWDVTSGGMFDDLWDSDYHVIPPIPSMKIPKWWTITRAYDHGQSHPFAVGWWLESNGEPITLPDGQQVGRMRGDKILWKTWYGSTGDDNDGLRMSSRNIARGVFDMEEDFGVLGRVEEGPADTEIFVKNYSVGNARCPADDMEEEGLFWFRADKSPGSRVRGWTLMRQLMQDAKPGPDGRRSGDPGLFVCSDNREWIELVPTTPRCEKNEDDIPDKYEDHLHDMSRYYITFDPPKAGQRGF